jgi:hypothetical protein
MILNITHPITGRNFSGGPCTTFPFLMNRENRSWSMHWSTLKYFIAGQAGCGALPVPGGTLCGCAGGPAHPEKELRQIPYIYSP